MKKRKIPGHKKGAWFAALRGSYIPVSWKGWLTYIPFVAYLVFAFIYGRWHTDSIAEAVLFIVPNFVAAAAIMTWIAKNKS
jgi:hypothetical protein